MAPGNQNATGCRKQGPFRAGEEIDHFFQGERPAGGFERSDAEPQDIGVGLEKVIQHLLRRPLLPGTESRDGFSDPARIVRSRAVQRDDHLIQL
jgi:hypothetical protein